jgi:hypothetical protein
MNKIETFPWEGMNVSVEETDDALAYTFRPRDRVKRPGLPLSFLFVLVVYPLALLVLVVYARSKVANRPEWEDFLTGVFLGQLLAWLVVGTVQLSRMLSWWYRPFGTVLKFTRTHLWHGDTRVCELEQVRGLRTFVYETKPVVLLADSPLPRTGEPNPNAQPLPPEFAPIPPEERPPPTRESHLSLVISEEGDTHGLFGAFDEVVLRGLAEHIHRRLSAFRLNQGIMEPFAALDVTETTEDEAAKLMHTRPAPESFASWGTAGMRLIFDNRWAGIVWCATIFAGVFASGRMIGAAGFSASYLLGHGLLAFVHFALFMGHIGGALPPKTRPDAK